MKIPLSWLREYVDIDLPPEELAHRLTMAGTEVGSIDVVGGSWDNVFVGYVTSVDPHPNADRLRLATVSLDGEEMTVVCGAPNIAAGQKVPFAKVGASLIDSRTGEQETLKAARIRGVESAGMVCSERELALGDNHDGIVVLPDDAPVGKPLQEYLGDVVFDLDVTPNRPDCLSVLGVAREVAALTGASIKEPDLSYLEEGEPVEGLVQVDIVDPTLCPRYTASVVHGIQVGPSPKWMQDRLIKAGQRPINNVVDVTNYVMLEYGQPLHAFNYDTIGEARIIVRPAREQEVFVTLDEADHTLRPPMLVIADARRSVALAGIMGGLNTEMTDDTTTVLLESANFDPINTRRTSQALRLRSESSSRFDKGLQPELAEIALRRATQLVLQLAGGRACKGIRDAYPQPAERPAMRFTLARLKKVLGIELTSARVQDILTSLGFTVVVDSEDALQVTIPYWRSDITQEDDLVEEVARIVGYDELPIAMLSTPVPHRFPQPERDTRERARDIMAECGMQETISYSLTSEAALERVQPGVESLRTLRLANPMSGELEHLRPTLRSSILSTLAANQHHSREGIRLFEVGRVYTPQPDGLPMEREMLVGVVTGRRSPESWLGDSEQMDFFDAKGILETFLGRLRIEGTFHPVEDPLFMSGRCARIAAGQTQLGVVGEVHATVLERFEIDSSPVALFEVDLAALMDVLHEGPTQAQAFLPTTSSDDPSKRHQLEAQTEFPPVTSRVEVFKRLPRYPGAYRDLAVVLDRDVAAGSVQRIIERHPLVAQATLFDVYEGAGVPDAKRSLAYRVLLQHTERTLSGDEVDKAQADILAGLEREVGAQLRG